MQILTVVREDTDYGETDAFTQGQVSLVQNYSMYF